MWEFMKLALLLSYFSMVKSAMKGTASISECTLHGEWTLRLLRPFGKVQDITQDFSL